jgi:hypothetical protein
MDGSIDGPGAGRKARKVPPPASPEQASWIRAEKKKELTLRLFGCFIKAIEDGSRFQWRLFREEMESALWDEAMRLAEGNRREAAFLVGVPYSTFVRRCRPGAANAGGSGSASPEAGGEG